MDSIVLLLKEGILPKDKSEADKIRRKVPRFWLSEDKNCTSTHFLGRTYSTFTLRRQSYSLRSYIKGFMKAIQKEDLCLTEPSLKAIGGQYAKRSARIYEEM